MEPRAIALPNENTLQSESVPREIKVFSYRFAIFRVGVFYRWEQHSDVPLTLPSEACQTIDREEKQRDGHVEDIAMGEGADSSNDEERGRHRYHEIPLELLQDRERYVVQDVLGSFDSQLDLEQIREPTEPTMKTADSLLHNVSSQQSIKSSQPNLKSSSSASLKSKRKVGLAASSSLPPFRFNKVGQAQKQAVHLTSKDGLVVVSAFLPVVLHRSDDGQWSADWDYEMLLSMQTHLRVIRVGVVKWRGWHGNSGADGSPEAGVPDDERSKVEACLMPFHCVPVWVDPLLFGEM